MKIYPSILTHDGAVAQEQLDLSQELPDVDTVQFDVIDGYYVDNLTLAPTALAELEFGDLRVDLHLMVNEPLDFVYEARDMAKQLPVRAIIAQIERMSDQMSYVEEVRRNNWQVGLSLDLYTPLESVQESVWELTDIVQIMGIQAGYQGQEFKPQSLAFIEEAVKMRNNSSKQIEVIVDGGIKAEQVAILEELGVQGVTVGSALWNASSANEAFEALQHG